MSKGKEGSGEKDGWTRGSSYTGDDNGTRKCSRVGFST